MKKFLSMFAFAAAIVLGAFTLASCGNDDDEPSDPKHNYSLKVEMKTSLTDKKQTAEEYSQAVKEEMEKFMTSREMTEREAGVWWMAYINDDTVLRGIKLLVDDCAKTINDPFLACTITLMKDGQPDGFHTKTIYTSLNFEAK